MSGSFFCNNPPDGSWNPYFYAYYYKQWKDYKMAYHEHCWTEIMYVIQGICTIDVLCRNGQNELVTLRKGEFIILDADVPHRLIVEQDTACRMLNVEFGFIDEDHSFDASMKQLLAEEKALSDFVTSPFEYLVLSDPEEVYYVLKSLVLELDRQPVGHKNTMMNLLFLQLFARIARLREEVEMMREPSAEGYVKRCILYMHQNYDRNIQIKDLAEAVRLHPGYLQRIFKTNTSQTLTEYLTGIRMEKAKMLLQQTAIPIHELCDYVGVSSSQYFHTLFKKHTGLTPSTYREQTERRSW
ncbi:AraC family transcriptional regulator [Paenibacillus sp. Marseille-Q4541]|uniref:AraC family transcriptional regulator n=1 Tax=Paenibacillus sp. Marseille-Q4541 TaxID=2831522 RepID=UPI001BA463C1|nr:AraC family transcriptional regulator [Paenibacillus sp. Marseille-Q4541]